MTENEIATIIVDAAYKIHKRLGPGLLESVYEATLAYGLQSVDYNYEGNSPCPSSTKLFEWTLGFVPT